MQRDRYKEVYNKLFYFKIPERNLPLQIYLLFVATNMPYRIHTLVVSGKKTLNLLIFFIQLISFILYVLNINKRTSYKNIIV